jgi:hypothetical protein
MTNVLAALHSAAMSRLDPSLQTMPRILVPLLAVCLVMGVALVVALLITCFGSRDE